MTAVYIDANVLYHGYCPVDKHRMVDWILERINSSFPAITCEWSIAEVFRAFKKQVNLGVIKAEVAQKAIDFFLADVGTLVHKGKIRLVPVSFRAIIAARELIFDQNLYAADAVHATIARQENVAGFITFDAEYKVNLGVIPILKPFSPDFKQRLETLWLVKE